MGIAPCKCSPTNIRFTFQRMIWYKILCRVRPIAQNWHKKVGHFFNCELLLWVIEDSRGKEEKLGNGILQKSSKGALTISVECDVENSNLMWRWSLISTSEHFQSSGFEAQRHELERKRITLHPSYGTSTHIGWSVYLRSLRKGAPIRQSLLLMDSFIHLFMKKTVRSFFLYSKRPLAKSCGFQVENIWHWQNVNFVNYESSAFYTYLYMSVIFLAPKGLQKLPYPVNNANDMHDL